MHNCFFLLKLPRGGDVYFIKFLLFVTYKVRRKVVERRCEEVVVQLFCFLYQKSGLLNQMKKCNIQGVSNKL